MTSVAMGKLTKIWKDRKISKYINKKKVRLTKTLEYFQFSRMNLKHDENHQHGGVSGKKLVAFAMEWRRGNNCVFDYYIEMTVNYHQSENVCCLAFFFFIFFWTYNSIGKNNFYR